MAAEKQTNKQTHPCVGSLLLLFVSSEPLDGATYMGCGVSSPEFPDTGL